jgi:rubrerythrin
MIRKLIIKNFSPLIWKWSRERKIEALQEFSAIEKDSGNQILWALELIPDPRLKALIFQHVLEEYFHAEIFNDISHYYAQTHLVQKLFPRENLVTRNSPPLDVWEFFAYAHVGEDAVNRDFSYYASARHFDKKISSIFYRVAEDEKNHIHGTREILLELVSSKKMYYWLVLKSKIKRNMKQLESYTSLIGAFFLREVLRILFYIYGFFFHKTLEKYYTVLGSEEIVKLMKEQQAEL